MNLGELVDKAKGDKSIRQLAEEIGMSEGALRKATNNQMVGFPRPRVVRALAYGLGLTPSEILQASCVTLGLTDLDDSLESIQRVPTPFVPPATEDGEAEYWREHAMRYRERLARYEGLRPLSRRHRTRQQLTLTNPN